MKWEWLGAGGEGFAFGFSLILAIGAQNAYVLRQGLLNRRVFLVCSVCALSDAALIAAGVLGVGGLVASSPAAVRVVAWGGAAFLFVYGALRLRAAMRTRKLEADSGGGEKGEGFREVLLATLALTWLNPHVYLDTVLLLGGISARFAGWGRFFFGLGAVLSSFVFFFSLGYGARKLAPVFARPAAWRILDALVAAVMFAIGFRLIEVGISGVGGAE